MPGAQHMHRAASLWAGDPLALPGGGGDPAIQAEREFQGHERPVPGYPQQKPGMIGLRLRLQTAQIDGDSGGLKHGNATPGHARVGVAGRNHHPGDANSNQGGGTRRGLAMVRAGFQRDIGRGPAGICPGHGQRLRFGMGAPAICGMRPADDPPVLDNHASNRRIWPDPAQPAPAQ